MLPNANDAFATALAAALADLGLTDVCLSPGSRNTPLTLAFARRDDLTAWIHHDERSAGFFALGLSRATDRPVALVCTSGTAATEYFPAVTEAAQTGVPLIVLTADRPPELRDVGAPQAIDQIELYGTKVKWFYQGAPPDAEAAAYAPHLAAHAWGLAIETVPGPVHLNLPFREPLTAAPPIPASLHPVPQVGRAALAPTAQDLAAVERLLAGRRTLFVVGGAEMQAAAAIGAAARRMGAVVFADPQSGMRAGPEAESTVPHADLLAAAGALDVYRPEAVVRWGALPTSKTTWRWLETHAQVPQILIDPLGRDPLRSSRLVLRSDLAAAASGLPEAAAPEAWAAAWDGLGVAAADLVRTALDRTAFPNEPGVAATILAAAPEGGALFAGSSMPIRDLDAFGAPRSSPLHIVANRGANGIDGSISTAAGLAAAGTPTVALIGDVAALHDVGALGMVARFGLPVTVVVVHNDGGGIFGLLPQADPAIVESALFERVFGTPHGTDFVAVAKAFGVEACSVATQAELAKLVAATGAAPCVIQVATDRAAIAPFRGSLVAALREVVGAAPA